MARQPIVSTLALALFGVLPAAAQPAEPPEPRNWLALGAGASVGSLEFDEQRELQQYAETGQLSARHSAKTGAAFEAAFGRRFGRRFGVLLGVGQAQRDASADYQARLPHPLYFDRDREASGSVSGLDYTETEGWLDLSWGARSGRLDLVLVAGLSLLRLETEMITDVVYDQQYPYDSVNVTRVDRAAASDTGVGWNAGAGVSFRVSRRLGVGALARYVRAGATLAPSGGATVDVDAGGLRVMGGVRLLF